MPKTDTKSSLFSPPNNIHPSRRRLLLHFSHSSVAPLGSLHPKRTARRCRPLCSRMGELLKLHTHTHTHKCRLEMNNPIFTPTGKEKETTAVGTMLHGRRRESIPTKTTVAKKRKKKNRFGVTRRPSPSARSGEKERTIISYSYVFIVIYVYYL